MLKAVIFDMDGVLVDSEPMHAKANILALQKFNISIPMEYCYRFIGSTTYFMCQSIVKDFSLDVSPEELLEANIEMKKELLQKEGHLPIPYVVDLIKDLHAHGIKLAIASSSPLDEIEGVMSSLQIKQYFDIYISGMSVAHPKPAPDIFLKAADLLQISPSECIIIEDSMNGVNAAYAAGITSIGFANPNSGKQDLKNAAMQIEGFEEIDFSFLQKVHQHAHNEPVVIAVTERLILRELTLSDIIDLYQIYQSPEVIKYIDDIDNNLEVEIEKHKAYIQYAYHFYGYGLWGIFLKEDGHLIGRCGIENKMIDGVEEVELGFLIDLNYWGQGIAVESTKAVLSYTFTELQISRVVAIIDKQNDNSIKVVESIGMKRDSELFHNHHSCYKYVITNQA